MTAQEQFPHCVQIATTAHAGQKRKLLHWPYIIHPLTVAVKAQVMGLSWEAVNAAVLHDVPEDTAVGHQDLENFGVLERTRDLVFKLTNTWGDGETSPEIVQQKVAHYARITEDHEALCLKLLDRADNFDSFTTAIERMIDGDHGHVRWGMRYLKKSNDLITPMAHHCTNAPVVSAYMGSLTNLRHALEAKGWTL